MKKKMLCAGFLGIIAGITLNAQEPVVKAPAIQEPIVQESVIQEPINQEPAVQESVAQESEPMIPSESALQYAAQPEDEYEMEPSFGREYYYSLLDKSLQRRWVVTLALYADLIYKGFCCEGGGSQPLANSVFNAQSITVGDIYLLSRLAAQAKITATQHPDPQLPFQRPPSSNLPSDPTLQFGEYGSDLYVALLAPVTLNFTAEQKEFTADITVAYRFFMDCSNRMVGVVGFDIPIKTQIRTLDLELLNGTLFSKAQAAGITVTSNSISQFFSDWSSVEDFVVRGVLQQAKGITYIPRLEKTGFGDISLFAYADFANYWQYLDALQLGINISCPTSKRKDCADFLWGNELGSGGFHFNEYLNGIFNTGSDILNPSFKLVLDEGLSFSGTRIRVPKIVSSDRAFPIEAHVDEIPGLINIVPKLNPYSVQPFSELDSLVAWFADDAPCVRIRPGLRVLVGIGNYFYNVFHPGFRLGIFYDYTHKSKDSFAVCNPGPFVYDTSLLCACSETTAHRIGWNLAYQFRSLFEVTIGSQHIVLGKNVPKVNEAFASIVAVF